MKMSLCYSVPAFGKVVSNSVRYGFDLLLCSLWVHRSPGDKPTRSMQVSELGSSISSGFSFLFHCLLVFLCSLGSLSFWPHGLGPSCYITGAGQRSWEESKKCEPVVKVILTQGTQIPPSPMLDEYWAPSFGLSTTYGRLFLFQRSRSRKEQHS